MSALPYVFACALNILSSLFSDKIIQSRRLSRGGTRKLFGSIGLFVPLFAIIGLSFVTCQYPIVGIILLVIGISFSAMCWGGGHLVNINDIAGPFSGILFGISNTIATLSGILAPYLVGVITANVIIYFSMTSRNLTLMYACFWLFRIKLRMSGRLCFIYVERSHCLVVFSGHCFARGICNHGPVSRVGRIGKKVIVIVLKLQVSRLNTFY